MFHSPFSEILYTNAVPNDTECQAIRDLLVGPRKEAADLAEEILRLTAKRDQLITFIDAHSALVSPARRLPDDVVREIFIVSLPAHRGIISGLEPPLLLCHISHHWRMLALSTPRLWTSLHIVAPWISRPGRAAGSAKLHQINEAAQAWISRSGTLPLSISFVVRSAPIMLSAGYSDAEVLLDTLLQCSDRWESIRFTLPWNSHFVALAKLSRDDVPILRSAVIDIQHRNPLYSLPMDWSVLSFLKTPRLDFVSFRTGSAAGSVTQTPLRWEGLRHLVINTTSIPQSLFVMLQQCTRLETCAISLADLALPTPPAKPIYMVHLARLSLQDDGPSGDLFFSALVFPNLRFLEYTSFGSSLPFIANLSSVENLQRLCLKVRLSTRTLVECFRVIPMLQELLISGEPGLESTDDDFDYFQDPDDSLVPWLTPGAQEAEQSLCPQLRSITLLHFSALSDETLLAFLLARTEPHLDSRLSSVHVRFSRLQQVDVIPFLCQRMADGLKVSLHYSIAPSRIPYSVSEGNQPDTAEWEPFSTGWESEHRLTFGEALD